MTRNLPTTLVLGVALFAGSADASIIFDNGLPIGSPSSDFGSYSFTSTLDPFNQFRVADDFTLGASPAGWSLAGASWSGVVGGPSGSPPALVGADVVFDIFIYGDLAGRPDSSPLEGTPGSAIAHRQVTVTGYDIGYGAFNAGYDATFAPITLDAGTPYWLSIAARDAYTFDEGDRQGFGWAWWGRSGTGNAYQGGTEFLNPAPGSGGWYAQGRQQEFILRGTAIPEPSTIAVLLLAGLGSLGAARRRLWC